MSTVEPPDANEEFEKLMAGVELELVHVENVSLLDDLELSKRYNSVRQELLGIGEMIEAKTESGRELHSLRAAYLLEMRRRGMA